MVPDTCLPYRSQSPELAPASDAIFLPHALQFLSESGDMKNSANRIVAEMWRSRKELLIEDIGRLRKFATRHEMALTILGAFIVFLGFVIKEGYQEQNRELASAVGAASNIFAIRNELQQVDLQLRALRANEKDYGEISSLSGHKAPRIEDVEGLIVLESRALVIHEAAFKSAEDLYQKLPDKSKDLVDVERSASEAIRKLDAANKQHRDFLERIRKEAGKGKPDPKALYLLDGLVRFVDIGAAGDVNLFGEFTLSHAEFVHTVAELNAAFATKGSYVLFALGWGLGLMGKLLKVPVMGTSEE